MIVRLAISEDEKQIDDFVAVRDDSCIYHTTRWKKIIEATYGYKPFYILCLNNGRLTGFLPLFLVRGLWRRKRLVGIPYSHMVEPLFEDEAVLSKLLFKAVEIAKQLNADYIQLKCELPDTGNQWKHERFYFDSKLDLEIDISDIFNNFKPSTRRNIKKAQKTGITLQSGKHKKHFHDFYELIVETRKRQGAPPYAKTFFYHLYEHLDSEQMQLYFALYNNRPVAGIIMLYHGLNAVYAYGASVSDRVLLQMRPNDLLFWNVIKDARQKGYHCFDFGITPFSNQGLLRFKSQWGTTNTKVTYAYYLNRLQKVPTLDRSGKLGVFASNIFRSLPNPLLKAIGPVVLKLMG